MPIAFRVAQQHVGRLLEIRLRGGASVEKRFGRGIAPRLVRHAAQREARLRDGLAVHLERRRDRDECEGVREPLAQLQIRVVLGEALGRQLDRGDDLSRLQIGVALGRFAW